MLIWAANNFMLGGFINGIVVTNQPANAGATGDLVPGSGKSPGGENSNLLQYTCLENPLDGGAWWSTVHGITKESDMKKKKKKKESDMTKRLSTHTCIQFHVIPPQLS